MKKLLTIVLVLGLAGLANAEWLEHYEFYTPPEKVADRGPWLDGGWGAGDWWRTGSYTHWLGVNSGVAAGSGAPEGNHINLNISSGTTTYNALIKAGLDRGSFGFGQEAYGTGDWPTQAVIADFQAGWNFFTVINGTYTQYGSTANPDGWGWHEIELSVNMDDRSAYVKIRDVDDTTGLPIGAGTWGTSIVIPAGGIQDLPLTFVATGHKDGMLWDGLGVPEIPAIDGDVNEDGFVGGADMIRITTNWGLSPAERIEGDLNDNDVVGAGDYQQVLDNWGNGVLLSEPPEPPGATPEPSTLLLLAGAVLAGLIRPRWIGQQRSEVKGRNGSDE